MINTNVTVPHVQVGDHVIHPQVFTFGDHAWPRRYDVLAVQPGERFGKPDLILHVRITCVDVHTGAERVTDSHKPMWLSQVLKGL